MQSPTDLAPHQLPDDRVRVMFHFAEQGFDQVYFRKGLELYRAEYEFGPGKPDGPRPISPEVMQRRIESEFGLRPVYPLFPTPKAEPDWELKCDRHHPAGYGQAALDWDARSVGLNMENPFLPYVQSAEDWFRYLYDPRLPDEEPSVAWGKLRSSFFDLVDAALMNANPAFLQNPALAPLRSQIVRLAIKELEWQGDPRD